MAFPCGAGADAKKASGSALSAKAGKKPVLTVFLMMAATLLSKLLGMLRTVLYASHYGTTPAASAFSAASRIPLTFFDLLFSAAVVGCFIPVYNSFGKEREKDASAFALTFLNLIFLATGLLALLGILFADSLIAVVTPGLDPETASLAARLLRMLFPMIIFTGEAYTLVGILQSDDRFLLPAIVSSVSNLGVILYFLIFDKALGKNGIYGLAVAYVLSWLLQFLTLAVPLFLSGKRYRPILQLNNPALKKALRMTLPIMAGSWLAPLTSLIGAHFSSLLASNGNAVFDYSYNIFIIVAGVLTYSICNYVFPSLSRTAGQPEEFHGTVRTGLLSALAITAPFTAAVMLLAGEGVTVLYFRNEFTAADVSQTASMLRLNAAALPAFAVTELGMRVFYAKKRTLVPVIAACFGAAVNLTVAAVVQTLPGIGTACALGQLAAASVLLAAMIRTERPVFDRAFLSDFLKILAAAILSAAAMYGMRLLFPGAPTERGLLMNLLICAAVFLPGGAVFLLTLKLSRASFLRPQKGGITSS